MEKLLEKCKDFNQFGLSRTSKEQQKYLLYTYWIIPKLNCFSFINIPSKVFAICYVRTPIGLSQSASSFNHLSRMFKAWLKLIWIILTSQGLADALLVFYARFSIIKCNRLFGIRSITLCRKACLFLSSKFVTHAYMHAHV